MIEPILFMATGAALYGSVHHLYHGAQHRSGYPHVMHAMMFLLLAGFTLSGTSSGFVHSLTEFSLFSKLSVTLGILLFATLPWFITLLLQQRAGIVPALITFVWSTLLLLNIASPYSLLYQDVMMSNAIPDAGLPSVTFQTIASPVWHLIEISMLGTLAYALYLCLKHYQGHGKKVAAAPVAGLLLLLTTTVYDFLVYADLIHSTYLAPLGFLLFLAAAGAGWRSEPDRTDQRGLEDANHYQLTLNFNQVPDQHLQKVPTDIASDTETTVTQLTHQPIEQKDIADAPAPPPPLRVDNPVVDRVSDSLVDIAVDAGLILKRLEKGDIDTVELRELGRKVRNQAIETRRLTHRMLRTEQFGQTTVSRQDAVTPHPDHADEATKPAAED
jgi:hypothetical protein